MQVKKTLKLSIKKIPKNTFALVSDKILKKYLKFFKNSINTLNLFFKNFLKNFKNIFTINITFKKYSPTFYTDIKTFVDNI